MNIKEKLCHVINRVAEAYRKSNPSEKANCQLGIRFKFQPERRAAPSPKNSIGQGAMCQPRPVTTPGADSS